MSGFVARTSPATGFHDPLLVQALVVEDTALVTVDVVGLHEEDCATIRQRCPLPEDRIVVHATHTHGGPVSMRGRLGQPRDDLWWQRVLDACVDAVTAAWQVRVPVVLRAGYGPPPGVARNRRRPDGPVDDTLPVVRLERDGGSALATVVSYACHPVVLGADNTLLTADYPGVVRRRIAAATEAPALFLTGCAGDANTGHTAQQSISVDAAPDRTFEECERIGTVIADAALRAELDGSAGTEPHPALHSRSDLRGGSPADAVRSAATVIPLRRDVAATELVRSDVARWRTRRDAADPATSALLTSWLEWAEQQQEGPEPENYPAHVTALQWGSTVIVALPGEPFAAAAHAVRNTVEELVPGAVAVVAGYSDGCPGYLPSREEYDLGGYEVDDAHRYYGAPGPFTIGSLEAVVGAAGDLLRKLT
jgi:hypothetical protein